MEQFVLLLLADLASKSLTTYLDKHKIKTAHLDHDYKRIIEVIMYQENDTGKEFAELIDVSKYYEHQLEWEEALAKTIKKVCSELNKNYYFNIEKECICIGRLL